LSTPWPNTLWICAKGLLIQQVPGVLYSHDTSGNFSKKWSKHCLYIKLVGVPPKHANQEYNF
ncbi:hypothetical protein DFH28DRAFT_888848, partial [Melampsora americana]